MIKQTILFLALLAIAFSSCNPTFTELDKEQKQTILNKHNDLRQQVASGHQYGQPSAANMQKMEWNDDLAKGAQEQANKCEFQQSGGPYGENLSVMMNSLPINPDIFYLDSLIQMWYDQESNFNPDHISPYQFDPNTGAYTQIEWADSNQLGCGVSVFKEDQWHKIFMVCRYLQRGNMLNQTMYIVGDPCENCPQNMQCDKDYNSLCSNNNNSNSQYQYFLK